MKVDNVRLPAPSIRAQDRRIGESARYVVLGLCVERSAMRILIGSLILCRQKLGSHYYVIMYGKSVHSNIDRSLDRTAP
jgi:hypothetical protein